MYVIEKDSKRNVLIVGPHEFSGSRQLVAENANWIEAVSPNSHFKASVKIRYKANDIPGDVEILDGNKFHIDFENPVKDITPGQAAVLYNGDICLGGGIISS